MYDQNIHMYTVIVCFSIHIIHMLFGKHHICFVLILSLSFVRKLTLLDCFFYQGSLFLIYIVTYVYIQYIYTYVHIEHNKVLTSKKLFDEKSGKQTKLNTGETMQNTVLILAILYVMNNIDLK